MKQQNKTQQNITMLDLLTNVKLTKAERQQINSAIVAPRNIVRACAYAKVHFRTFNKALHGQGNLKSIQRKRLLEFCKDIAVVV